MNRPSTRNYVPRETIDEIRNRSDIVEVISECGIALRPAGRDFKALCPFHTEKTPSFTVSVQKQIFYCFGCQTGGNVITFVKEHEGKSFIETIEWLAGRLNIALPNQDARESADRKRVTNLEDLNRFAVEYYHRQLLTEGASAPARQYLKHRGVQPKTLRSFQLGYAKSGRRELVKAATDKGFTTQQLIDVGLIKDEDRGPQDRFWNRILFPIQNERGAPVGFGGRALSEEHQPKYLNSPATVLYDKSKILYNLDKARQTIYKQQRVLLVEGYMDVLMLYQSGVENVVASSGTSLSEDHARLLKRFAPEVVIVYDGDASGFQAAQRGLLRLLTEDLRVRIALLPTGEDPDSFTRQHGVDAFTELIDKSINLIEFQIQSAIQSQDIHRIDVKTQIVKEVTETLLNLKNRVERSEYIKYAARDLHVDERVLWGELRDAGLKETSVSRPMPQNKAVQQKLSARAQIEHQLVEALIQNPALIPYVKSQFDCQHFTEPRFAKAAQLLWEASTNDDSEGIDIQALISECPDENLSAFISSALLRKAPAPNLQARVDGCLKKLRNFHLQDLEQRVRSHALAEGADEMETLEQLVKLSNERRALRGRGVQDTHDENLNEEGVDNGF
ncbi:MAG: DNA primase [Candidatus Poribacteria bacterium]|nr:DNA primase [Candidatus Poribacteria bacterium]